MNRAAQQLGRLARGKSKHYSRLRLRSGQNASRKLERNAGLESGSALSDDRQMDTIEEYKIIESQDLGSLGEKVNAALKEGWQPHGGPFIHVSSAAVACCQAMVNFHQPTSAETIAKLRRAAVRAFRR